ncbi:DNA primase [Flavobacterium sp. F372]|uniref:Toprim domain-containing protein n=1 Tax=Flavobacterium bernardetii TaxID=2813823 RepID=A0ABR7IVH0_9FLAO|nr:toprim domain-containing protein [Flavobacterium bernardetii]MBC5833733.1 toprim domain-containing protein [Flavobacterium bernardetii]NHF68966.1 DNA primase [Flavobacterium bernardetii]
MNIEKAKQIPIELVLKKMNYTPSKTNGFDVWYLSPLHDEKTASFKINTKINRWYDHGLQKGGNIIDFIAFKFNYTIPEVLKFLENYSDESIFSFQKQKKCETKFIKSTTEIKIIKVIEIQHFALKQYLENRKIYHFENEPNLREVHYEVNGKKYFGIGFQNRSNGFEIRSKYAKICIGKKDISLIVKGDKNKKNIRIFEGFTDYISFKHLKKNSSDYLILNSIAMINRCDEILSNYDEIELYFDQDEAGNLYTKTTLEKFKIAKDCRGFYKDFKDLNEWLVNTIL